MQSAEIAGDHSRDSAGLVCDAKKIREILKISRISREVCGGDGIEIEPFTENSPDFDLFYIYLKELLDVVDEMGKSAKKEN